MITFGLWLAPPEEVKIPLSALLPDLVHNITHATADAALVPLIWTCEPPTTVKLNCTLDEIPWEPLKREDRLYRIDVACIPVHAVGTLLRRAEAALGVWEDFCRRTWAPVPTEILELGVLTEDLREREVVVR